MKHELPKLPYEYNALEPIISKEIMELHHGKHHNAYVTKLNEALEKYEEAKSKGDVEAIGKLLPAINFNGGGHVNHSLFWENLAPVGEGSEPSAELKEAMAELCGSFEKAIECFNACAAGVQGSGWCWFAMTKCAGRLVIRTCQNQDMVSAQGVIPLLGIDVWEHAYYLDYKNARPKYLENIWKVINWSVVNKRFKDAKGQCGCK